MCTVCVWHLKYLTDVFYLMFLLSLLSRTLLVSLFKHIRAYLCECAWTSVCLCTRGCVRLCIYGDMHTSGSTAHLYLSIDFELNF